MSASSHFAFFPTPAKRARQPQLGLRVTALTPELFSRK
jgi:hypothetical protein